MASRASYAVERGPAGLPAATVCDAVFDVLDATIQTLRVDAYSDFSDQMPSDIRAAQEWLRSRGFARGDGDPGVSIVIGRADTNGWALAQAYAPWSIRTSLVDGEGITLATLGDGGHSVTLNVDESQVAALRDRLGPAVMLVPLSPTL